MELSRKLQRAWTGSLLLSTVLVGLLFASAALLHASQQRADQVAVIEGLLDTHFAESNEAEANHESLQPALALIDDLVFLTVKQSGHTIYQYPAGEDLATQGVSVVRLRLPTHQKRWGLLGLKPLFISAFSSLWWLVALLVTVMVSSFAVLYAGRISRQQMQGVALLQQRGEGILNGQAAQAEAGESPAAVSQALDQLQQQIKSAQQERSRFDQFIRDNTFTDLESGFGNRRFFDNRLDGVLRDSEANDGGAVYLIQLQELDLIKEQLGEEASAELVSQFSNILGQLLAGYNDTVIARRSSADFAALVPNLMPREVEDLANKLQRGLRRLAVPEIVDRECFIHIGVALFAQGDEGYQVLSEADMALRAAQLQGPSCWFMYDRGVIERGHALGSVRWRALLENAIARRTFVMFTQSAVTSSASRIHHHEVLTRVRDDKGQLVSAGVFLPMASRCGLLPKIDRIIIEQLIKLLEYEKADTERCSINLSCDSLMNDEFMTWLLATLDSHPAIAHRIIIEVSEYHVSHHQDDIQAPLLKLQQTGCQLLVDRVGQTVVGSHYINKLKIDYLKLHHSIVRDIQNRPENQLFVRSLSGSLEEQKVHIFALGVETEAEWRTLRNLGVYGGQGHFFSESLERVAECTESS
ncbi:EAL domain-containing protein [Corallincola luteus]|uniref:EAL domain-containing protein n=1 Tax=Corallincola luteus TaxID=1775177 RepID=A0ABY2AKT2_9GAMM|nr:EAL domain-containing protein [Corallincola luteus]TCI03518.1 EAL domain-containing protein [Corallincola luteus]